MHGCEKMKKSVAVLCGLIVISTMIPYVTQILMYDHSFTTSRGVGGPGVRSAHVMVYDTENEISVLFGGFTLEGGIHSLSDTWTYDYSTNTWTELSLIDSPPARAKG